MTSKNPSISVSNPFEASNKVIATCYLSKPANEQQKFVLDSSELQVVMDTSTHEFRHEDITNIQLIHSKLLFFVIGGGVLVPLSLLGIFEHVLNTGLLLLACLGGLAMLYHGLNGTPGLRIWSRSYFQTIPLSKVETSDSIAPFLDFYQKMRVQLLSGKEELVLFAVPHGDGFMLYLEDPDSSHSSVQINLMKISAPVQFVINSGAKGLFVATINPTAILDKS